MQALCNDPFVLSKVSETSTFVKLAVTDDKLVTDALMKDTFVLSTVSET
jgi:hypothetical protein